MFRLDILMCVLHLNMVHRYNYIILINITVISVVNIILFVFINIIIAIIIDNCCCCHPC